MPVEPVVDLDRVSVAFDRPILRDISLTVPSAETLAVVGESGTGKSTLLRLILGLQRPDAGRVRVMGRDVNAVDVASLRALRRNVGMVFQGAALFDSLSTFDNVAFALRESGTITEAEVTARVHEALRLVDLDPDAVSATLPAALSGGMRKRVGIARAIAPRPALLLYDEPTAGLDPLTGATVIALMQRLQRELGVTSVIVSHDIRGMFRIADRIALLREGQFAFVGAPAVMQASDEPYTAAFLAAA